MNLWSTITSPADRKTRQQLQEKWNELPPDLRHPSQMYGRHQRGCGATIGMMPRCDFGCTGCYLGREANSRPAVPISEIKRQILVLKPYLGRSGNLQLTDGEVSLRDPEEVIEIIRFARSHQLAPMLMTHGETFRSDPSLLPRFMREGGLEEICIHIDTTQVGRKEKTRPRYERELHPLREEFADLIREARRETGLPLRAASTITVTPETLPEVGDVAACYLRLSDAFRMVSFQPMADVGRTRAGAAGPISTDRLWQTVSDGLAEVGFTADGPIGDHLWNYGDSDCNQFMMGVAARSRDGSQTRLALVSNRDKRDHKFLEGFYDRFPGLSLRLSGPISAGVRLIGLLAQAPLFWAGRGLGFGWRALGRLSNGHPVHAAAQLLTGKQRVHSFMVVAHHFMDSRELTTQRGQERLESCVFRVAIGEDLVPMCKVNATGLRDEYYTQWSNPAAKQQAKQGTQPEAS